MLVGSPKLWQPKSLSEVAKRPWGLPGFPRRYGVPQPLAGNHWTWSCNTVTSVTVFYPFTVLCLYIYSSTPLSMGTFYLQTKFWVILQWNICWIGGSRSEEKILHIYKCTKLTRTDDWNSWSWTLWKRINWERNCKHMITPGNQYTHRTQHLNIRVRVKGTFLLGER